MTASERGRHATSRLRREYSGRCVLRGAQDARMPVRHRELHDPGDGGRAEIDDFRRAGGVDHDVFRAQILMRHFQPVKGAQTRATCSTMPRTVSSLGFRVVDHPLRQRLPLDEFGDEVEVIAPRPGGTGFSTALPTRRATHSSITGNVLR